MYTKSAQSVKRQYYLEFNPALCFCSFYLLLFMMAPQSFIDVLILNSLYFIWAQENQKMLILFEEVHRQRKFYILSWNVPSVVLWSTLSVICSFSISYATLYLQFCSWSLLFWVWIWHDLCSFWPVRRVRVMSSFIGKPHSFPGRGTNDPSISHTIAFLF